MNHTRTAPLSLSLAIVAFLSMAARAQSVGPPVPGDEPAETPDEATKSAAAEPATDDVITVRATDDAPRTPAEAIRRKLDLSDRDKQVLINVRDNTQSVDEPGFYLMLSKVAALPSLDKPQRLQLDSPAIPNLALSPDDYRHKPMRLLVRVHTVSELTTDARHSSRLMSASPYWPSDKAVWKIHAVGVEPQSGTGLPGQPIVIYSPIKPPDLPGDGPGKDGYVEYGEKKAPLYSILAVFYKAIKTTSRGSENESRRCMQYPVVLAWQWDKVAEVPSGQPSTYIAAGVIAMGVLLAGAIFAFLRKRAKRYKQSGGMWQTYQPRREAEPDEPVDEDEPTEVDPDLAAAAREYRTAMGLDESSEPGDAPAEGKADSEESP
ncbi:MAG: hypothetical protein GVY16_01255 [Planctomycetes bacterium]|jgi:hypothetical protein|nr:hypothetical protein [Planctomycetota bacterium]